MKLITRIEYRTCWGQELFMRSGDRLFRMEYTPGDIWVGTVGRLKAGQTFEYRYELHQGGVCIRTEWDSHKFILPASGQEPSSAQPFQGAGSEVISVGRNQMEVRDFWSDVPADLPLRSAPFRNGVFKTEPGRAWRAAGTAVPVFSLRSEKSFGVGEFNDLKALVDWAALTGQKVLQLLPVNDTTMTGTWEDSYPYNANSSFALHPQFIHLPAAGVEEDEEYVSLRDELNALPEVDYERVNNEKRRLLAKAFARTGRRVAATEAYRKFVEENASWLLPYAAFCTLRDEYGTADFTQWKTGKGRDVVPSGPEKGSGNSVKAGKTAAGSASSADFSTYDEKNINEYIAGHRKEIDFHCFVQYHLHCQLVEARDYAHSKGIIFKGDLPIGVSRTSADAWVNRRLFHLDSQAGAPPDAFSTAGQNWGFPTYNWEEMSKDGYSWWKGRLGKMSQYFDAFRIDHILGFFRIWEIPMSAVHGLLGHFNPAMPYSSEELGRLGFDMSSGRYSEPYMDDSLIDGVFGGLADKVRSRCMKDGRLRPEYSTQRKVLEKFPGKDGEQTAIREGLMHIIENVLFVEDPRRKGMWHPRIAAQYTCSYRLLDEYRRRAFDRLYDDFFYRRHNAFWKESAMRKLPSLLSATGMLACGEDLGMIPDCVPDVMNEYQILSLEIQRMPKNPQETFADPAHYPYRSVCTTSTHDMNPIRAWWEEDRSVTARFWHEVLGGQGDAPWFCEPWICRRIVEMHLSSPSMLAILPLQDWLATDGSLRLEDPSRERINIPAIPRHYWRYRMHLTLESLLLQSSFNSSLREMISASGRY